MIAPATRADQNPPAGNTAAAKNGPVFDAGTFAVLRVDFRKLDTTNAIVAPWIDANGKFGKSGTTLWIAFLARLASGANSGNGGVHLYDGIGDLTLSADGDKANHERMFMGDRASGTFWFMGRTCGGCPCGVLTESTNTVNGTSKWKPVEFEFSVEEEIREVELVAELRTTRGQVWFDAQSLHLSRKQAEGEKPAQ